MLSDLWGKEVGEFCHCPLLAKIFVNERLLEKQINIQIPTACCLCPCHPCFSTDKPSLSGSTLKGVSF